MSHRADFTSHCIFLTGRFSKGCFISRAGDKITPNGVGVGTADHHVGTRMLIMLARYMGKPVMFHNRCHPVIVLHRYQYCKGNLCRNTFVVYILYCMSSIYRIFVQDETLYPITFAYKKNNTQNYHS